MSAKVGILFETTLLFAEKIPKKKKSLITSDFLFSRIKTFNFYTRSMRLPRASAMRDNTSRLVA
jgi:hypothetical protein